MIRTSFSTDAQRLLKEPHVMASFVGELNRQLDELFRAVSNTMGGAGGLVILDRTAPLPATSQLGFTGDSVSLIYAGGAVSVNINTIAHALLGAKHSDTLAGTVVRGDVITGNSTPKWSRLALGTTGKVLKSDGTDAGWGYVTTVLESGATVLTIGAVSDGQYLKRSGSSIIGAGTDFSDTVLGYVTATDGVTAGAVTGQRVCEFIFDGSTAYPSGLTDAFSVDAETTGTGTIALVLRDIENSTDLATVSLVDAVSRDIYQTTTFSNVPSAETRIQLQITVPAGMTLTLGAAKWRRKKAA